MTLDALDPGEDGNYPHWPRNPRRHLRQTARTITGSLTAVRGVNVTPLRECHDGVEQSGAKVEECVPYPREDRPAPRTAPPTPGGHPI